MCIELECIERVAGQCWYVLMSEESEILRLNGSLGIS